MNQLEDRQMCEALAAASQEGVNLGDCHQTWVNEAIR